MTDTNSVFLDEIGMKYMFLSLFAHDPWHDFNANTRIDDDIIKKLQNLVNLVYDTPVIGGEKRKYSDMDTSEIVNIDNNTDIIEYKKQVVNDFVESLTNEIFSDGLLYTIDLLEDDELNPNLNAVSFDALQENIIKPAIKILKDSKWSSLSVVHNIYKPELLPILEKSSITIDLVDKITEVENKTKQNLYSIVLSEEINVNNEYICKSFWDLPHAISKINSYIEDNNSNANNSPITPLNDDILLRSNDEILSILRSTKNKIIRPMHPDKDHTIGAEERFQNIKSTLELIIDSCFTEENIENIQIENIQIEKKRKIGGTKTDPNKIKRKSLIQGVLIRIIKYFLKYTDTIQKSNSKLIPKFYLLNNGEDIKTRSMKLIINCEIFLLWITYTSIYSNKSKTELKNQFEEEFKNNYNQHDIEDYFEELSDFHWYSDIIDESSLDVLTRIALKYYPENVIKPEDMKHLETYVGNSDERFVVNNFAEGLNKVMKMDLSPYVYCPLVSIVDGMGSCKFSNTSYQHPEIISKMNLNIEQIPSPDFYYVVEFIPDKSSDNIVKLNATIGKAGQMAPVKINETLNLHDDKTNTRLETKNTLRVIVDKMLNTYTEVSQQPIQLRSNITEKTARYNNLFNMVKSKIMGLAMVKGIGDWGQEIHVLTKKGGFDANLSASTIRSCNNKQDELRIGLTKDQVSASRMIFMRLFADNINEDTIVGYQQTKSSKNILISDKSFIDVLNKKQSIEKHHNNSKLKTIKINKLLQSSNKKTIKNKVVKVNDEVKNTTKKIRSNNSQPVPAKSTIKNTLPKPPVQNDIIQPEKKDISYYIQNLKQYGVHLQLSDIQNIKEFLNLDGTDITIAIDLYNYITTYSTSEKREEKVNKIKKIVEEQRKMEEKKKAEKRKRESEDTLLYLPPVQNINNKPPQPPVQNINNKPSQPSNKKTLKNKALNASHNNVKNITKKVIPPTQHYKKLKNYDKDDSDEEIKAERASAESKTQKKPRRSFKELDKLNEIDEISGRGGTKKKKGSKKKQTKKKYSQ